MARTTLDLDPTVLAELRERSRREHRSMGEVASELLAGSFGARDEPPPFRWRSAPMGALIDIEDKEALWRVLDDR